MYENKDMCKKVKRKLLDLFIKSSKVPIYFMSNSFNVSPLEPRLHLVKKVECFIKQCLIIGSSAVPCIHLVVVSKISV